MGRSLDRLRHRILGSVGAARSKLFASRELARPQGGGGSTSPFSADAPIFFIIGWAKSGTSWLMRILDSHPEILCKGEGRFFGRGFKLEDSEQARARGIQSGSLYGAIADTEALRAWIERSVWTRGDDVDRHLANLTHLATRYFLTQKLAGTGKKIVGDKTPISNTEVIGEISEVYPQAKVIHIIRDGRDVAVSTIHHIWNHAKSEGGIYNLSSEELQRREDYRGNRSSSPGGMFAQERLANIAAGWKAGISRPVEEGSLVLGTNYTEIRYEDLLEKPEDEIRRLFEFLGAGSTDKIVDQCLEASSFERMSNRKRGEEDPASFFRKGVSGDWKNVFTKEDKQTFKEVAGDLLVELGYEKDDNW